MLFNPHSDLAGKHSFLSASKSSWVNYDEEKFDRVFRTSIAAARGSELHEWAAWTIKLRLKMARSTRTINSYVNDAISYRMQPEVTLFYSMNAFCTVDAISFSKGLLRIHDLKTGVTPATFRQLMVYAAYFCLEYRQLPHDIAIELRIYQNDEIRIEQPDPEEIVYIMDRIKSFDRRIELLRAEATE